ncbi:MAG TPA: hypothetical protein VFQ98_00075 [Gallionella sp.]|nr:hypothetical protein [Gallionella sp.]
MAKQSLGRTQIAELVKLLRAVFQYHHELRKQSEVAHLVQFPKIPSALSESLVVILGNQGLLLNELNLHNFQLSEENGDVVATSNNMQKLKIEVKATGNSAFQFFGDKDIESDILVWVHFDNCFKESSSEVKIFTVINPKLKFEKPQKITLSKFKDLGSPTETVINLDSVLVS